MPRLPRNLSKDFVVSILQTSFVSKQTPCGLVGGYQRISSAFSYKDWGSMFPWNVITHLQVHATSQPRMSTWTISQSWESQITYSTKIFCLRSNPKMYLCVHKIPPIPNVYSTFHKTSVYLMTCHPSAWPPGWSTTRAVFFRLFRCTCRDTLSIKDTQLKNRRWRRGLMSDVATDQTACHILI